MPSESEYRALFKAAQQPAHSAAAIYTLLQEKDHAPLRDYLHSWLAAGELDVVFLALSTMLQIAPQAAQQWTLELLPEQTAFSNVDAWPPPAQNALAQFLADATNFKALRSRIRTVDALLAWVVSNASAATEVGDAVAHPGADRPGTEESDTDTAALAMASTATLQARVSLALLKLKLNRDSDREVPAAPGEADPLASVSLLLIEQGAATRFLAFASAPAVATPSLETLALVTFLPDPQYKTAVLQDTALVEQMLRATADTYSVACIVQHLVQLPRAESDDAKMLGKLRQMAAGKKAPVPRETPADIERRIAALVRLDCFFAFLTGASRAQSPRTRAVAGEIWLALATPKTHRGLLLQNGAVKHLLYVIDHSQSPGLAPASSPSQQAPPFSAAPVKSEPVFTPIQALAKLLITSNPHSALTATQAQDAYKALGLPVMLYNEYDDTVPLLLVFECLMALTNIASMGADLPDRIATFKLKNSPKSLTYKLYDCMLLSNTLARRAATELICNLAVCEEAFNFFTDANGAKHLELIVALCSSEDTPTALAAAGGLAVLTEYPPIGQRIATSNKFMSMIFGALDSDNLDLLHRLYVIIANLTQFATDRQVWRDSNALSSFKMHLATVELPPGSPLQSLALECLKAVGGVVAHIVPRD